MRYLINIKFFSIRSSNKISEIEKRKIYELWEGQKLAITMLRLIISHFNYPLGMRPVGKHLHKLLVVMLRVSRSSACSRTPSVGEILGQFSSHLQNAPAITAG